MLKRLLSLVMISVIFFAFSGVALASNFSQLYKNVSNHISRDKVKQVEKGNKLLVGGNNTLVYVKSFGERKGWLSYNFTKGKKLAEVKFFCDQDNLTMDDYWMMFNFIQETLGKADLNQYETKYADINDQNIGKIDDRILSARVNEGSLRFSSQWNRGNLQVTLDFNRSQEAETSVLLLHIIDKHLEETNQIKYDPGQSF